MTQSNPQAPSIGASLNPGDLVDEREAAAILSTSVQTLRNWRWARKGPRARKVGQRLVRYHRADLAAFVEAGNGSERAA
jgi:predicted DNA-binding transcriptional regulator AlpA